MNTVFSIEDILRAADRCASRRSDGMVDARDVYYSLSGHSRNYRCHNPTLLTLKTISTVLMQYGYEIVEPKQKGRSRFKKPAA